MCVRASIRALAVRYAYNRGYLVTDDGVLISPSGKRLSEKYLNSNGYQMFNVVLNGVGHNTAVAAHQLAAYQKFGEAAICVATEVRHLDNDKLNNRPANICIGSQSDNMLDRPEITRKRCASIAASSLRALTVKIAQRLIDDRVSGTTYQLLSKKYGISKTTVSYIVCGHTYPELDRSALQNPK